MKRTNLWLVAILLLAALSLWVGRRGVESSRPRMATPRSAAVERTSPPEDPVHLVVLNGTQVGGLANRMGVALAAVGCVVERIGDAPHQRFQRTLLINRRLPDSRAQRLARRLGGITVLREWDGRSSEDAVLVLGADHPQLWDSLRGDAPLDTP